MSLVFVKANLPAIPNVKRMFIISGVVEVFSSFRQDSVIEILISLPLDSADNENSGLVHGISGCLLEGSWRSRILENMKSDPILLRN